MAERMIGIINPDGYEKVNRVYNPSGDCPTLTARDYKDPIKILDMRMRKNTIVQSRAAQMPHNRSDG